MNHRNTFVPELVIFDCDGTLVDSERIANAVFAEVLTAEGLPTSPEQSVVRYMGRSIASALALVEAELGRPLRTDVAAARRQRVNERLAAELTVIPGIEPVLRAVAEAAIPCCVASSSGPAEIEFRLARTGLTDFFGGRLFSATQVPNGKPAPDVFLFAAEEMGAAPRRCVVVEDSPIGVRGGVAAGMRVVGFADLTTPEALLEAGAHTVVETTAELATAIGVGAAA